MKSLRAFVRLSRPHFLIGGFLMYALGAVLAGPAPWPTYVLGQLLLTTSHLTAHYVNEFADYEVDMSIVNRTAFSGGSGALTSGALTPDFALKAAYVTSVACLMCAVAVATYTPWAALVAVITLAISWMYSIPPFRLVGTGWGEIVTALTVAGLYPVLGALAQGNALPDTVLWAASILVPVQFVMLLGFELPDLDSDARAGKRVLGVRIGARRTVILMALLTGTAIILGAISYAVGGLAWPVVRGALLGLIPLLLMFFAMRKSNHRLTTLGAVAAFALSAAGMLLGAVQAA